MTPGSRRAHEESALWPPRAARTIDVAGLGQCSLDHVGRMERWPGVGQKSELARYEKLPGGSTATSVLAAARLGLRTAFLGAVGDDADGRLVAEPLRKAGVELDGLRVVAAAPTRTALILVDEASGERTVLWHRDARLRLDPADLSRGAIERAGVLLLDAEHPEAAVWAARIAREAGIPVVADLDAPGPGVEDLLGLVDFPIVAQTFAESFFEGCSKREALRRLCQGGARLAAITLGEVGAIARIGERVIESPAFPITVRDTTGAGDVFHGAFGRALILGYGPERALRTANAAAAIACQSRGAQGGLPSQAELDAFLASARSVAWRDPDDGH